MGNFVLRRLMLLPLVGLGVTILLFSLLQFLTPEMRAYREELFGTCISTSTMKCHGQSSATTALQVFVVLALVIVGWALARDFVRGLEPILFNVPLQILAYHAAAKLGRDIDKPRNLAKSVTVE